jgi:uncharacterized delta-60 repeat protein
MFAVAVVALLVLFVTSVYAQEMVTLTVKSQYGSPDPPVGRWQYAAGTVINASVGSPVSGGTGIRYFCTGWKARGSPETLPPTGSGTSVIFTITTNTTLTWLWETQYCFTAKSDPPEGGYVTPPSGWYKARVTLTVQAHPNPGYIFSFWAGALRGITNPQTLTLRGPRSVTALFSPLPKKYFTVISAQGAPAPPVGTYESYESATVNANCGPTPYPLFITNTRYICTGHLGTGNLTDGPETSVSFVITVDSSVTWLWQTQYYLTVVSYYDNPQGEGWFNEGATANWSVISPYPDGIGTRYVADPASGSVLMDAPKTVIVNWIAQYYLTVNSPYGNPQGEGWFNEGATANWSVISPYPDGIGTRYVADPASGSVLMDAPKTVIVNWIAQYYLTVNSPYGNPQGEGWFNAGTTAHWSVTSPWSNGPGVRCVANQTSGNVLMDAPKTVTVSWTTQYYLTVDSAYGAPVGAGWYLAETTANWSVTSPWAGGTGIQYVTSPAEGAVLMDSPKTVTVTWTTQYELTTAVSPEGGGTVTRSPDSDWYDSETGVQLTAVANTGYLFTNWSGDLSGTTNPEYLTMSGGPKSVTANFAPQAPVADFSGTPTSGYAPLIVQFTDASTGLITSWEWDFDNNGTVDSTEQNPSYTYASMGIYTVKLTVTGPGGSGEELKADYITVSIWAKSYGSGGETDAYSIQQTNDGGYIVAGVTSSFGAVHGDFWVLKLNADGTVSWQKRYGLDNDSHPSIQQTSDGGYIVAGQTVSGEGYYDLWILKLNIDGSVAWQKTYGGTGHQNFAGSIQQTSDGGYIVTGTYSGGTYSDFWVLKLNSDGTVTWQKKYTGLGSAESIQQTSDGGYIVAGGGYGVLCVLKLNNDGTVAWQKSYAGSGYNNYAQSIQQTSDGGFIVAGGTDSFGAGVWDFWVLKLNSNGTVAWQKRYGGSGYDWAYSIRQTIDGGYIVAGRRDVYVLENYDFWVLKLNSDGTVSWQKRYGGGSEDQAYSIQQTSDGGYIVAGNTYSFGAGSCNFWVLKLNSDGRISFNPASGAQMADTNAVPVDTSASVANTTATVTNTSATVTDTNATVVDTNATIVQQAP